MPTIKLTKKNIDALAKPEKGEVLYWDTDLRGFGLRVATDRISFIVQARIKRGSGAKSRRWTIGEYGKFTPDTARAQARQLLAGMAMGHDPRDSKVSGGKGRTLQEVADERMTRTLAPKTRLGYERLLKGPLSRWTDKPMVDITTDMVSKEFTKQKAHAPIYANAAFSFLGTLFKYAMEKWPKEFLHNPVRVLDTDKAWTTPRERTTRIPDDKVHTVWRELQAARTVALQRLEVTSIDLVCFMLLTGCRLNEACPLTWGQVDLKAGWWHIPNPKNGNAVWLPLCSQAVELLHKRPRSNSSDYVFATPKGHITTPRKTMQNISTVIGLSPDDPRDSKNAWCLSPHDLRRTFVSTGLRACRIELWKVEALTNHISKGVTLQNYGDTQHLEFLLPEAQAIGDRIAGAPTVGSAAGTAAPGNAL